MRVVIQRYGKGEYGQKIITIITENEEEEIGLRHLAGCATSPQSCTNRKEMLAVAGKLDKAFALTMRA